MINKYYIKGIIEIFDDEFEIIQEDFFYAGLEKNGMFQSASDLDTYLPEILNGVDWGIEKEDGDIFSVLVEFDIKYFSYWTDCGEEHDSEFLISNLVFDKIDDENKKWFKDDMLAMGEQ